MQRTHTVGVSTDVVADGELDALLAELADVVRASPSGARTERGFSMILDGALQARYPGIELIVARDRHGRVQGFHRYAIAGAGSDVTLDVPWRRPTAPNGIDERLSVDMIRWAKAARARRLPWRLRRSGDLPGEGPRATQTGFYVLIHLGDGRIKLESLYRYPRKFNSLCGRRYALLSMRHLLPALLVLLHWNRCPGAVTCPHR